MLKLSLSPDDYLTINGNIVVQLTQVSGGRAYVAVEAAREIPIIRGRVLERDGAKRPDCLAASNPRRSRPQRDGTFRWNEERRQAAKAIGQSLRRLEEQGAGEEAAALRAQLNRLLPALPEDGVTAI